MEKVEKVSNVKVDDEPLFYRRYWKATVYIPKDVYDANNDIDDVLDTMNESLGKISEHIEMYEGEYVVTCEKMKNEIEKLIEKIRQDINENEIMARRLSDTKTEDKPLQNWVEGIITGLEFALEHVKQLQEND